MRTLAERIEIFKNSDLYPVVSSEFCNDRDVCEVVSGIAAAGARIVQIREKNISDCAMFELVQKCKRITDTYQMLLIVDDRLDIAMAAEADGVHLGRMISRWPKQGFLLRRWFSEFQRTMPLKYAKP